MAEPDPQVGEALIAAEAAAETARAAEERAAEAKFKEEMRLATYEKYRPQREANEKWERENQPFSVGGIRTLPTLKEAGNTIYPGVQNDITGAGRR